MSVLETHAKYNAFGKQLAELNAELEEALAGVRQANEHYRHIMSTTKLGASLPPTPPTEGAVRGHHQGKADDVRAAQDAWVAENFDKLETEIHKAEDELVGRAAALVGELDGLGEDLVRLLGEANSVRMKAGKGYLPAGVGGEPFKYLVAAARRGERLIQEPRVQVVR